MKTRVGSVLPLSLAAALIFAATAHASGGIRIGINSQQYGSSHARVDAHIRASARDAGRHRALSAPQRQVVANLPPAFPLLPSNAPILRDPHPGGPGSFWYTDGAGHVCQYVPKSVVPCFTLVRPHRSGGGLSPAAIAQSLTRRLDLAAGAVRTSPTRRGLTGAESWFWLDPAPRRQTLSISLAGETVSVVADPTVEWRFGDGGSLDSGPGVPYRPGAAPSDAVRHVYQTRCLPGDQGHDPYVLASCGPTGYTLDVLVVWQISYRAVGPVAGSGTLPTRTTASSRSYPVGESRAFLVSGGSG